MATKKILNSLIGTGIKVTANGSTDVLIGAGAFVDSSDNYAIYMTGSGQTLTINGTVRSSGSDTIKFGDAETDKNHVVIIEKTGMVIGDYDDALSFESKDFTVVNKGTIIGYYPIYSSNSGNTDVKITNSGTITATSSYAVYVSGDAAGVVSVNNSGRIYALEEDAISVSTIRLKLVNTGTIISRDDDAVSGHTGNDSVVNKGKLVGQVTLGEGNDLYDGRLGLVVGDVYGDGGNDRLFGGKGAEFFHGGEGNDRLMGGGGKDQLSGNNGDDSFVFNKLSERGDLITDYSNTVGNDDRILISAAGFGGGLAKGVLAASRFQVRGDNVAQDGNDRFIYNTTDGTLWFDKDGSGSANAVKLATIPMVTMTSADIVII